MATTPDADLAALLAANGQGTVGTDIFTGPMRGIATGIPASAIFVESIDGLQGEPMTGGAATRKLAVSRCRVILRWMTDDFSGGRAKARAIRDAADRKQPSGYINIVPEGDEPRHRFEDKAKGHVFEQIFQMRHVRS